MSELPGDTPTGGGDNNAGTDGSTDMERRLFERLSFEFLREQRRTRRWGIFFKLLAVAYVTAFGGKMPHARPSMLLDHLERRRSEIDAINGMVPVLGVELGFPTPYNSVVSDAVRAREENF